MCSYCLPNPRFFCKIHCSLSCAVLPCALIKYLVNRMAYDESTAWFHVQHCLKPLRLLKKEKWSSWAKQGVSLKQKITWSSQQSCVKQDEFPCWFFRALLYALFCKYIPNIKLRTRTIGVKEENVSEIIKKEFEVFPTWTIKIRIICIFSTSGHNNSQSQPLQL